MFATIQLTLKATAKSDSSFILIKENNTNIKVLFEEILYIESNSNYIYIFCKNKKIVTRQSLEWAELNFPDKQFIRIHRSYMVNMHAIEKATSKSVYIRSTEIPISRANTQKMADYFKKKK